jgi:hypothetical protein
MRGRPAIPIPVGGAPVGSASVCLRWVLLWGGLCLPRATAAAQQPVIETPPADSAPSAAPSVPQRDVPDVVRALLGRKPKPPKTSTGGRQKLSKGLLPIIGSNPSYGSYFGASLVVGGWLGDPATTGLSSATLGGFYATKGYTSLSFRSNFYLGNNRMLWKGDWRYFNAGQATNGLGPATRGLEQFPMNFVLYRFHQTVYRRTKSASLYVGLGYFFDRWDQILDVKAEEGVETPYADYTLGASQVRTTSSGLSFEVLHDSRDNAINATRGVYWNAALRTFSTVIGSDDNWQTLWNDVRLYPRAPVGGGTLAIWSYFWMAFGRAPYLDLPASGWDVNGRASRGYLQGRIRGQNQIYTEFEYRLGLTDDGLLGAVGFLNLMATTIPGSGQFGKLDPGYGVGLRLKFDKRTATNLAVDYARDRFGDGHLFFGMQEAF